jgi:hypothetical protein
LFPLGPGDEAFAATSKGLIGRTPRAGLRTLSLVTEHEARPWLARIRRQMSMKLGWTMMHSIHFRRIMNELTDREKRLMSGRV